MTLCINDEKEIKERKEKIRKMLKDKEEIKKLLDEREDVLIELS